MNLVVITGRLGQDAELKYTGSGTAILEFSVAVKESYKKNDQWESITEWFSCKLWGKAAESKGPFLKKGTPVMVRGKYRTESWNDKDGIKKSKVVILCDTVEHFASDKPKANPKSQEQQSSQQSEQYFKADDIPF